MMTILPRGPRVEGVSAGSVEHCRMARNLHLRRIGDNVQQELLNLGSGPWGLAAIATLMAAFAAKETQALVIHRRHGKWATLPIRMDEVQLEEGPATIGDGTKRRRS